LPLMMSDLRGGQLSHRIIGQGRLQRNASDDLTLAPIQPHLELPRWGLWPVELGKVYIRPELELEGQLTHRSGNTRRVTQISTIVDPAGIDGVEQIDRPLARQRR